MWPFPKYFKHKCADGTTRLVYKSLDDAFPLELKTAKSNFEGNFDALKNLKGRAKAQYETKIVGVLYEIDGQNNNLMLQFRAAYVAYFNNPCKEDEYFKQQTQILLREHTRLTEIKMKVKLLIDLAKAYPDAPEKLQPVYSEIIKRIDGSVGIIARDAAQLEITETREIASQWAGTKNDG